MAINFDALYKKMTAHVVESKAKAEIRASSMPFCPIEMMLKYSHGTKEWNYNAEFYTSVGTAIHSAVQLYLPLANPDILYGNWKCEHCYEIKTNLMNGDTYKANHIIYHKVGPIKCNICHRPMVYDELTINFEAPMSGHCDGVLLEEPIKKSKKRYGWILELKSTSKYNATGGIKTPYLKHRLQAGIYVPALQSVLTRHYNSDIELLGYIIKYISRDNPTIVSKDFIIETTEADKKFYDFTCKLVNSLFTSLATDKCNKLFSNKPCLKYKENYSECSMLSICKDMDKLEFSSMFKAIKPDLNHALSFSKHRLLLTD